MECEPSCSQLLAQLRVVIDLAVEHDEHRTIFGSHWLRARVGEIKNGKATMGQTDPCVAVYPDSLAVRTSVGNQRAHPLE